MCFFDFKILLIERLKTDFLGYLTVAFILSQQVLSINCALKMNCKQKAKSTFCTKFLFR